MAVKKAPKKIMKNGTTPTTLCEPITKPIQTAKKKFPNKKATSKHPLRLFGLITGSNKGQRLTGQVLCPTKAEAIGLFGKFFNWKIPITDKVVDDYPNQVVELGGMNLSYTQGMKPYQVREQ